MERRHHVLALFYQDWIRAIARQHPGAAADRADDRGSYKYGFHVGPFSYRKADDAAVELPAVRVPLHPDVHETQRFLGRVADFLRQQDRPGAGPEDRFLLPKRPERLEEIFQVQQLQHGGALAPGDHEAVYAIQVLAGAHLDG